MNKDIRITVGLADHHKTIKLIRKAGEGAFRCLLRLWCYAAEHRSHGVLHGMDATDIAIASGWTGDEAEWICALVSTGWLDDSDGGLTLHDWESVYVKPLVGRLDVSSSIWKRLRQKVFERDGFVCVYCGQPTDTPECDHVIPRAKGGESVIKNLVTACRPCNRSKRDKTPEEWKGSMA